MFTFIDERKDKFYLHIIENKF